jgi:hypothetical protein
VWAADTLFESEGLFFLASSFARLAALADDAVLTAVRERYR